MADGKWALEKIKTLKSCDGIITHLTIADDNTLIAVSDSDKMYVLRFDSDNNSSEPLELRLSCQGMEIDGLKSTKEYEFLKRLIEEAKKQI